MKAILLSGYLLVLIFQGLAQGKSDSTLAKLQIELTQKEQQLNLAEKVAIMARKSAESELYIFVSHKMAEIVPEITEKNLAGLVALQAYNFHKKYSRYEYDSKIHHALCQVLKNFEVAPFMVSPDTFNVRKISDELQIKQSNMAGRLNKDFINIKYSPKNKAVKFSKSGSLLASLDKANTIYIFNLNNIRWEPQKIIEEKLIKDFFFSSDERSIAIKLEGESTVHVWPLAITALAERICPLLTRNMTVTEWDFFVGDSKPQQTCPNLPSNDK